MTETTADVARLILAALNRTERAGGGEIYGWSTRISAAETRQTAERDEILAEILDGAPTAAERQRITSLAGKPAGIIKFSGDITEAQAARIRERFLAAARHPVVLEPQVIGYKIFGRVYDPADVTVITQDDRPCLVCDAPYGTVHGPGCPHAGPEDGGHAAGDLILAEVAAERERIRALAAEVSATCPGCDAFRAFLEDVEEP